VAESETASLRIDLTSLEACDGVGVALLTEIRQRASARGASVETVGGSDELLELISMAERDAGSEPEPPHRPGAIEQVGDATAGVLGFCGDLIAFVGDCTAAIPASIASLRRPSRVAEVLRQCVRVGADAVPVVSLLGGLVGYILAVQAVKALANIGGSSLVPMIVGFATLREFGPLIAAIILAGRSGSGFAAEIGTMKVTEELSAYQTLTLDPMVVLVFPRILAGLLVTPLLAIFSILLGVLGGFIPMAFQQYSIGAYLTGVIDSVVLMDLVQAMVKAAVFGVIVTGLGCFNGLKTGFGADAVGVSATRAVVSGIVAVLIADSLLSSVFSGLEG
jgi:phospholipid/cholesterol/gamma-HCH transport system permease protein